MANSKKKNVSLTRLMLLITVVNRRKAEFFVDLIQNLGANMQFVSFGEGTADTSMLSIMGLNDSEKAVIFSVIREDSQDLILSTVDDKFNSIKDGKGISYTIPFSSVIGASIFGFLSDNRMTLK